MGSTPFIGSRIQASLYDTNRTSIVHLSTFLSTVGPKSQQRRQQWGDKMSLYGVIYRLPQGKRVQYQSADGATVVFEPFMRVSGRLDVIVRKTPPAASDEPNRAYEDIDRAWCEQQELALRDAGIDPDNYTIM
jgi:hypothetical protein